MTQAMKRNMIEDQGMRPDKTRTDGRILSTSWGLGSLTRLTSARRGRRQHVQHGGNF